MTSPISFLCLGSMEDNPLVPHQADGGLDRRELQNNPLTHSDPQHVLIDSPSIPGSDIVNAPTIPYMANPLTYHQGKKSPRPRNVQPVPQTVFCKFCGKKFTDHTKYRAHEGYHARAGRFPCRFCEKAFHCKEHVVRHERVHTGERPYQCRTCGKTFTQKRACSSHEMTHFK